MVLTMNIESIIDNFVFLDDWNDRYKYLIELGGLLPAFPETQRTPENKVQGCVSQVWITWVKSTEPDPIISFKGDSDAHIVKGLIAIILAIYSDKLASEILAINFDKIFHQIGLEEHITPQRSNGLNSMVKCIRHVARSAIAPGDL